MESFKAVEKAMKTKAYSKEGLSAATKLDPREAAKAEVADFLSEQVDALERQIESLEAEGETIQATMKKGKNQSSKADRIAEIEHRTERHKWHQGRLELIKRALENGAVETEQVKECEESIKYYVTSNMEDELADDENMYDDLNLREDEDTYGMNNDNDRVSSQDAQSIQEDTPEPESRSNSIPAAKIKAPAEPAISAARRPSTQLKSPLPALATLHAPLSNISNGSTSSTMKPAAVPTRAPGETLKYASAAAAAAASDKMGIAPLPPPPEALQPPSTSVSHPPLPSHRKPSVTASPTAVHSQPASAHQTPVTRSSIPVASHVPEVPSTSQKESPALSSSSAVQPGTSRSDVEQTDAARPNNSRGSSGKAPSIAAAAPSRGNNIRFFLEMHTNFLRCTASK